MKCDCINDVELCVEVVPIFNSLSFEEKLELLKYANHKQYRKGEIIYKPLDKQEYLYIVHQGKIKLSRYSIDGKEQIIRILEKGEFTGELSIFSNESLPDYAIALEDTNICMLKGEVIKDYIERKPSIALKIIEQLSKRIDMMEELIAGISLHSVEWRLARYLLKMKDENNVVILNTTKGNFASQLGMSQETLSRKLSLFQENKYIKMITSKKIAILNINALENIT